MRKELWFGLSIMGLVVLMVALLTPWSTLENGHIGLLMLALIVVAIMLGFPTAFTLMGMGMIFTFIAYWRVEPASAWPLTLELMVQRAYAVVTNDVLISVPLFVFMGYLVERANLIAKLFRSLHLALFRVPGSLAVATLFTCAIFATATGIVGAVITLMGLLAMPAMLKAGYDPKVVAGTITAGGCLGVLLPPSVLLIIYSATAGVSVVQLYAGAVFPGLLLALLYVGYVIVLARLKPAMMPPLPETERQVPLPPTVAAIGAHGRSRVLPALWHAWRTPTLRPLLRRSAPAIATFACPAVLMGAVLMLQLLPADGPLRPLSGLGAAVPSAEAGEAAAADMFSLGAPVIGEPQALPVPAAQASQLLAAAPYALGGMALLFLLWFYARMDFDRLEILKMLAGSFFPLAMLMTGVLGSIVMGLATPTEAAAVGAFGGAVLAALYRRLSFAVVRESVHLTGKTSSMVCWLFVGSAIFSAAFALLGGQDIIERWVLSLGLSQLQFLLLAQAIIFLLGWPLEWTEIIVIFMPIFVPLLDNFGVDPLFFGLLVALNLQTAYLSPPVAMAAFYLKGIAPPHVTLNQIFAGMLPFMGLQIIALFVLYAFPPIGLWLPQVLYR